VDTTRSAPLVEGLPASAGAAALEQMSVARAATVLEAMAPADAADRLERMREEVAADVLEAMSAEAAAERLEHTKVEQGADILEEMEVDQAAAAVEEMAPDDAADVLEAMEEAPREAIVHQMEPEAASDVEELMEYPPDTAGGIMTTEVAALAETLTVREAIDYVRRVADEAEQIYCLYATDANGRLAGIVSLRQLLLSDPEAALVDVMNREVRSVDAATDKEIVARQMRHYDFLAMPVLDADRRLAGVVTIDDVVDVIQEENTEDVQRMVGAGADEGIGTAWYRSVRMRLPWLIVSLFVACLSAAVIGLHMELIAALPVLAVFLPVVANQGGNAGAQALTIVIRAMALGEAREQPPAGIVLRQVFVGLCNGLVVGTVALLVAWGWSANPSMGIAVGLAMLGTIVMASLAGSVIPMVLRGLGLDPAQASSIFLLTLTDMTGFAIFLGLASTLRTLLAA
jgi:magnesium transporter